MRRNRFSIGMHADFHRKRFVSGSNPDSRAKNSGFTSSGVVWVCILRRKIAANGKILPSAWQFGSAPAAPEVNAALESRRKRYSVDQTAIRH